MQVKSTCHSSETYIGVSLIHILFRWDRPILINTQHPAIFFMILHPTHFSHTNVFNMADTATKPRRRSWFQKNGGFTSFFMTGGGSSQGNSPPTTTQQAPQPTSLPSPPSRSRSLDMEIDNGPVKTTLASRISKAAKRGLKRIPTSVDLRRLDDSSDSSSSNKRSKVIPFTAPSTPPSEEDKVPDTIDDTFIASDEAEADRIQFKSDLIRLAFDG